VIAAAIPDAMLLPTDGNPTGDQYIRDVLQPVVVPHFDNHPLATRSVIWMTTPGLIVQEQ
jgi:hypothetical protein